MMIIWLQNTRGVTKLQTNKHVMKCILSRQCSAPYDLSSLSKFKHMWIHTRGYNKEGRGLSVKRSWVFLCVFFKARWMSGMSLRSAFTIALQCSFHSTFCPEARQDGESFQPRLHSCGCGSDQIGTRCWDQMLSKMALL